MDEVVARATATFTDSGYEGTSIDRLVAATGVHRGSLYATFGSKRGLFVAALRAEPPVDLLLVALLELAPRDAEVRRLLRPYLDALPDTASTLGAHLLQRAGLDKE